MMGRQETASLLDEILEEEKTADLTLTRLTREACNLEAETGFFAA